MKGKLFVGVIALLIVGWWLWPDGRRHPPGVLVPTDPKIEMLEGATPFPIQSKDKTYELTPQARYTLKARVLSINLAYGDSLVGPLDLTVGWGPMSDQAVLDRLKIWQDNTRHWFVQPRGEWPISSEEVGKHAVNTHLIPATPQIEKALTALGKGDLIDLEGKLVNVSRADGFRWNTSTDGFGFGDHSCKIVWVERVSRR